MTMPASSTAAPNSSSATALLDSAILRALRLAKAGATGIGIPGVEPTITGVLELATMLSLIRRTFRKLEKALNKLITINASNASGAGGDLKQRLTALTSEFEGIACECKSLTEKSRLRRFFKSKDDKDKIQDIKNSITSHIQHFTFYGNMSIEKAVEAMVSKVRVIDGKIDNVLAKEILSNLKCIPACYNADNSPDKYMDGTRVDIIKDVITRLSRTPDPSQRVVMLSGVAGSGKSTIAKSVASILAEEKGFLAASFFFSRDYTERKEIKHLATTLAIQLAEYSPVFRTRIINFLETDRTGILTAEPRLQFQKMIAQILQAMPPSSVPWVICLDALDECGKDRGQIFLRWLSDSIAQIPAHISFFLTGRPDVPAYLKFDPLLPLMHGIILDEIDSTIVRQDIRLYVEQSLDGGNWTTRQPWKIQSRDVEEITNCASELFMFAATAVRYVLAELPWVPPQESVDYLLGDEPLTDLHSLYSRIGDTFIPLPHPGNHYAKSTYWHDRSIHVLSTNLHLLEHLDALSLAALLEVDMVPGPHPQSDVLRPRASRRSLVLFLLAVFGIPYAMWKLVQILDEEANALAAHGANGMGPIDPAKLTFVRALYPFTSTSPAELGLKAGDIVAVLGKLDPQTGREVDARVVIEGREDDVQWWRGQTREGRVGWFPRIWVEALERAKNVD
ncbi:hypothetical protein DFH09DRAFT_1504633 [Mycena vulgaris]|nr:hypothetical protein DFH09DRAFT_1504633 [Mycena vulgaris]